MKWMLVLLMMLSTSTALAAGNATVYRCDTGGQVVFTDVPCTPGSRPAKLPELQTVPTLTPNARKMAKHYDQEVKAGALARDKRNAVWLKKYAEEKARAERVRRGLVEKRVVVGMTPAQVRQILYDTPDRIDGDSRHPRRWVFNKGRGQSTTIDFHNGYVSRIRERGKHHKRRH